jgi:hypothetical protein
MPLQVTGGACIGGANATIPLAKLTVSQSEIELSVPIFRPLIESHYLFPAKDVTAVKRYVLIPFLGWGIQIKHCIHKYPEHVVFWTFRNPNQLLEAILKTGFRAEAQKAVQPDILASGRPAG